MAQHEPEVKPRIVKCPACGGDSVYASTNPFRPFCSERCKSMDFGAWASENFRVANNDDPASPDDIDATRLNDK